MLSKWLEVRLSAYAAAALFGSFLGVSQSMVASQHVYRELNQWADDLSNGDAKNFDPVNRIDHRELESSMEIVNTLMTIAERRPGP